MSFSVCILEVSLPLTKKEPVSYTGWLFFYRQLKLGPSNFSSAGYNTIRSRVWDGQESETTCNDCTLRLLMGHNSLNLASISIRFYQKEAKRYIFVYTKELKSTYMFNGHGSLLNLNKCYVFGRQKMVQNVTYFKV